MVPSHNDEEQLCRDGWRAPFSQDRLIQRDNGRVVRPDSD